jgi:outer membrane receptor protein involved in Fe transport
MLRRFYFIFIVVLALLAIGFVGTSIAGDADKDKEKEAYEIEKILVRAEKENIPVYVQNVVTEDEVSRPTVGGSALDTLQNQAGFQFIRTSPTNPQNNKVRLRGFSETRFRVMVDGVPMQRDGSYGGAGSVHWSTLSTENIERIEIVRGAGPAKFGNTIGGVINIVTKKPGEKPKTSVSAVYGSFHTWDAKVSHSARKGPLFWSVGASHFETDGFLRNNFSDRNNVSFQVGLELPLDFEIGLGFDYSEMDSGMAVYNMPDSPFFDSSKPQAEASSIGGPGARFINGNLTWGDRSHAYDENESFTAYLSKDFKAGKAKIIYKLWNQDRTEYYFDAADQDKKIYERKTNIEDNNWSLQGDFEYALGNHELGFGGEWRSYGWGGQNIHYIDTAYFHPSINVFYYVKDGFKGQPHNKEYQALYAQDRWKFHPKWDLEVGVRQEWYHADKVDPSAFGFTWPAEEKDVDESHLDPRIALTGRLWKGGTVAARFGMVHRYPTSPEHFWWYLNKGSGYFNTELHSEEARQYELQIEQQFSDSVRLAVRGYHYDIENYISSTFVAGVGSVVYNINNVEVQGLEAEISAALPKNLRAWANLTLQEGSKSGDPWDTENRLGNELPNFPEHMFNIGLDYMGERLKAGVALNYVSSREHYDGTDVVTMGDYTLLGVNASYRIWENSWSKWDVLLSANNILDTDYQESSGYPMPGVTFMGGLKATF